MSLIIKRKCDRCGAIFDETTEDWCSVGHVTFNYYCANINKSQPLTQIDSLDLCRFCSNKLKKILNKDGEKYE